MTAVLDIENIRQQLNPRFGSRETKSIIRILKNDLLKISGGAVDIRCSNDDIDRIHDAVQRLLAGEPIQYITGLQYFFEYPFYVNPSVLIPRPETEELVEWILEDGKDHTSGNVLDIGTGSGCIPITISLKNPLLDVHGCDISELALEVAELNSRNLKASVHFFEIDILDRKAWEGLPSFDTIVSNPPYLHPDEIQTLDPQVKHFEPEMALSTDDDDPLIFYRMINDFAKSHLKQGGHLYYELSEFYIPQFMNLCESQQMNLIEIRNDLQGKPRMAKVNLPV